MNRPFVRAFPGWSFQRPSVPLRSHAAVEAVAAVAAAVALALPPAAGAQSAARAGAALEEIVVTAEFREVDAQALPRSVSVLDRDVLESATLQHFEEVTLLVPNLNWSGEGSRARYFQLRGIGELEQYEGAPNPSVGFLIDDIDFSALGGVATLFDVDRVEVLRGPQGTRYGANALGGLIYMRSAAPPEDFAADFELTGGNDDTRAIGAAAGGPLGANAGYRVSVHRYESNGFRDNVFLGRDDTYGRDELTTRAKFRWTPSERVDVEATALYLDLDNGYDAWAVDNGFTVYSDNPGRDAQRSVAGSVRVAASFDRFDVVSITGVNDTDATYSFDADWGNADYWAPFVYDYVSVTERQRRTYNQEVRLLSEPGAIANGRGEWLVGAYVLDLDESNDRRTVGVYDDAFFCTPCALDERVETQYDATNFALFGQIDLSLTERAALTAGLRWERRAADYGDTFGNRFEPTDRMLGGEVALSWDFSDDWMTYLRLARGYKAGGFNVSFAGVDFDQVDNVTPEQIEFDAESLLSFEAGVKGVWLDGRLRGELGVFESRRDDQQIKIPMQLTLGDPSSFLFLTENAERGRHRGLETSVAWQATDALTLSASVGLLDTKIERFSLYPGLEGREQAHAPRRSFGLAAEYRPAGGWWGRLDLMGRGDFYFDYGHDATSDDYTLVNVSVGREWGAWSATLWARNLLDEEYAVRGFFFGNEPPDFPDTLYTRLGDPRHVGLTLKYRL
jgi:iron complex outermembrane recepter protein